MENKTGKYLKYAIGEIILVMIGILLALQVNNWNEVRKENGLKNEYSNRLINDLKKDISTIEINKNRIEKIQIIISDFTKSLDSDISLAEKIAITEKYFTEGWSTVSFAAHSNTYSDLSQTGNMKVFKSAELRENILSYYALVDTYSNSYELNKGWVLPIDVTISEETNALGFSSETKNLYNLKGKSEAILEFSQQKKLLTRHASVHFWINNSFLTHYNSMQQAAEKLIKSLE